MKKINILFMCLSFWMLTSLQSQAQTPFSLLWNFTGSTTGATASTPPTGLTVGNMTIGNTLGTVTAISSTVASSGYTGASGTNNIGNAAATGALNTATSAYVQVVITPSAGNVFTFTGISLGARSTPTGPQAYAIRTSVDNYATTVASNTIANSGTWAFTSNTFTNSVSSLPGTAMTIRIYGYNGTGSAGTSTINWRLDDITITGTVGSATNPTLGTSVTALNFGSKCINTTSIDSFTINGNNLNSSTNIDVAALSGFQYSTSINGTFANNLSLTQAGGSYSQKVYVQYQPTVAIAYNGAVSISGGGVSSPVSLNITASGISTPPSVTAQAASSITTGAAVLNASGIAAGCGTVSNYYFEYSTTQNFTAGTGIVASGSNLTSGAFSVALSNLNSSTTYYYKAFVTNSNGVTTPSAEMSFTTLSLAPTLTAGTIASFGNQCLNVASAGLTLNIAGSNLQAGNLQVGPTANFKFSSSLSGVYEDSLIIAQSGGSFNQNIYVSFLPSTLGAINGTINVIGGGATQVSTTASGTGINTIPTLATIAPISIAYNGAVIQGQVTAANCGTISAYGIEWGTTSTLATGTTLTSSSNMNGNIYTSSLVGLTANTTYYYRAYAVSTYGTSYSSILSFTTSLAPGSFLWNFTGSTTGATATTVPTGVTVGNMTIGNSNGTISGAFINSTSPSSGYVGASGTNNIGNAAITGTLNTATSAYVQVVITPDTGMMYSLNGITLGVRSTGTGPQRYAIRTSLDNYATSLDTGVIPATNPFFWVLRSNSFSNPISVIDGTPLTIRIYGYGGIGNASTGTINWRLDDIILTGSLVSSTNPNLTLSSAALNFGSKCINNNYVDSFTVNGTNLDAASTVNIAPLNGFSYSTDLNGTYSSQLNIAQTGGAFTKKVYVQYQPTVAIAYNGQIAITGGGYTSTLNVNVTASGISTPPSVSSAAATNITASSATLNAASVVAGCGTISSYSFEYSTVSGFASGTGTIVSASNLSSGSFSASISGLNPITTYYYKATVTNSNGVSTTSNELSFTTFNLTPVLSASTVASFGNQCINTLSSGTALTLSGVNLTTDPIQVGPTANFKFSETLNGTYADSLVLTQVGGTYNQTVYVAFIPSSVGSVNASISINGGGATTSVAATGTGINTLPVVITNTPISISYNGAVLSGTISALNCGTVSSYGFEWSTNANLANAATLSSSNLSAGSFSADLLNLSANTIYYFRSFLVASNGTVYSAITSFQTAQIPAPTGLTATNITTNSFVANWNQVLSVSTYRLDVSTSSNFWGTPIALLGFNFNAQTNIPTSGITANATQSLSTVGTNAPTFNASGNSGFTARADGWNAGNGTKYWQTSFVTTGYGNVTVSSKQRSSSSGPKNFKLQYRVGNTGNFSDVPNATITTADDYSTGVLNNVVLPSDCNDKPLVFVRWIMTSNTSVGNGTVSTTGASNIDDIVINGAEGSFIPNYNNKLVSNLNDTVTGLSPNTNYYFRVRAESSNSLSANSATQSVLTSCVTPTFTGTVSNVTCSGNVDGAIALSIPTGANYTYSWTGANGYAATTKDINSLASGTYFVTVQAGACSASDSFTISEPTPLVATAIASDDTVCLGATVNFNATVSGGTGSYNYLWFGPNGFNSSVSNPSFATTLLDAGNYMLIVTDANGCSANGNVSIEVSTGYSNTTTATACDSYTWSVNNQTYTASGTYTVTNGCITEILNLTITPTAYPLVFASESDNYVCPGTSISFTANGTDGGSNPTYTWYVNTIAVPNSNNPIFTTSTLVDGDVVSVDMTSNAACASYATASSNDIQIFVLTGTPDVSIFASKNQACPGEEIVFTSTATDEGTSPLYQWYLNGSPIVGATNADYYALNGVNDGDEFYLQMESSASCVSTPFATSNSEVINVSTPTAGVTASGPLALCSGGDVTLEADQGDSYLWSNGATTQSITVNAAGAGTYTVDVTTGGCIASSNPVNVIVKTMPSTVKIKTVGLTSVCDPNTVLFMVDPNATSLYGFDFQWNLNGTPINGATDTTYTASGAGGGSVTLTVSGSSCTKTSAAKTYTIKPLPVATFTAGGPTTICAGQSVTLTAPTITGYTYTWLNNGVSAGSGASKVFKVAGVYTVQAKLNGCTAISTNSVNIVVNALPIAGITALTPATFCAGDSCTMQATPAGATNYAWINGTTTVNTNTNTYATKVAGTFKMMVTDANGCVSKVTTASVKTKVNLIPVASISASSSTTIAANGSVKLNASPSSGVLFQWYLNGNPITGATTKQYIATAGGDYTVAITKVTSGVGCTGMSAATTVTQTGIKEEAGVTSNPIATEEAVFELAAYPNPVSGVLTINVRGIEQVNATVQVMDFNGRVVAMQEMTTTSTTVDMTGYASGMYLIRYKDAEGRTGTIKINKQ